jgi:hypothetical protein
MVFIFTAVTVAPQAQLAREAGIVLCGMRRRARCVRLLHRTRAASSQPPTARFAGGSISWAYGMDHLGKPWWVDLSKEVGAWAKAAEKEAPPEITWELPVDAKVRSFNEKFVDAMLGLGAGTGSPADELLHLSRPSPSKEIADAFGKFAGASPTALRTLASESGCSYYGGNRSFPIPAKSVSSVDFWPTCLLPATFETRAEDGLQARLGSTLSELVAVWPKLVRDGGDQADTRFQDPPPGSVPVWPKPCADYFPSPQGTLPGWIRTTGLRRFSDLWKVRRFNAPISSERRRLHGKAHGGAPTIHAIVRRRLPARTSTVQGRLLRHAHLQRLQASLQR